MIDRVKLNKLRAEGKTYEEIGIVFGVTRQRIHAVFSGYTKRYYKTENYKMYRRHIKGHFLGSKPYKPCKYCAEELVNRGYLLGQSSVY